MPDADLLIPLGQQPITVDGQTVTVDGVPVTLFGGVTADLANECFLTRKTWRFEASKQWRFAVKKFWRFEAIGKCGSKMPITLRTKKAPAERIIIPFDYGDELSDDEVITSVVSVTVAVVSGTDAAVGSMQTPVSAIESGGKRLLVPLRNGVSGLSYDITALVDTSNPNKRLSITARLTVLEGA